MNANMDDHGLLLEYVRNGSEEAFRELVARHLPMVFAAAHRVVGDPQLAEDLAQAAFTTLAQKAASLDGTHVLGGWLYETTRNLTRHAIRTEQRRRAREKAAVAMQSLNANHEPDWLVEHLEPAMGELEGGERDALVLRYLEDCSLREVGRQFGISEDAARMRVNRALEHLRAVFARRGIKATSGLVLTVLGAMTTEAVPPGLSASVTATALAVKAAALTGTTAAHSAATVVSWLNAKTLAAALGVLLAGMGIYLLQGRQIARLRDQNGALLAQQQALSAQFQSASQKSQAQQEELRSLQSQNSELLRLRNEVSQLRRMQGTGGQSTSPDSVIWSLDILALAKNPPVVLIRPTPEENSGRIGMMSSNRRTIALGTYLSTVVAYAYDIGPTELDRILMPQDAPQGLFDFLDALPTGGREAMRELLKEQYGLAAKREMRSVETLLLTVSEPNAPGLKLSGTPSGAGNEIRVEHTYTYGNGPPLNGIRGEGMSMTGLAVQLRSKLGLHVVDQTGLTDRYDYELSFAPDASVDQIKQMLSDQLGLSLAPAEQKQSVEFLVVEKLR